MSEDLFLLGIRYRCHQATAKQYQNLVGNLYQEFKRRKISEEPEGLVKMQELLRIQDQVRKDLGDLRLKRSTCIGSKNIMDCDNVYLIKCYRNYVIMTRILEDMIRLDSENMKKSPTAKAEAAAQAFNP